MLTYPVNLDFRANLSSSVSIRVQPWFNGLFRNSLHSRRRDQQMSGLVPLLKG
jgi:hypothetical protein